MQSITYTDARNNLKEVLDTACEDDEVIIINRKEGNNCVVMSLDHYNGLTETAHLLSSPANAKRLVESIEQLRDMQTAQADDYAIDVDALMNKVTKP